MPAPKKKPARKKRSITEKFFSPRQQRDKLLADETARRTLSGQKPKKKPSEKTPVKRKSRKI